MISLPRDVSHLSKSGQENAWSSRPGSVSGSPLEQLVNGLNLSPNIRTAHPSRLPLPDHVHGLVFLDRSPRRVEFTKALLGLHPSFDRSMVLLQDVVQVLVHPVNGEVPPVKGRPWKLPHYANRGKTSSSGGELASARSCFSTVRTALGKLRITGLLARFDVARSFPQFPRPLLLQPTIWTSERGADLGSGRCQPRPHLPIYRMTPSIGPTDVGSGAAAFLVLAPRGSPGHRGVIGQC